MALSPNYGFPEPDNSSLVKNGAQDIRALGDAVDTAVWNGGFGQAGKNKIINGDFSINQRAFTSTTGQGYTFDRWIVTTSDGTVTSSPQTFTAGAAPVAGYEGTNYFRMVTSGQTLTTATALLEQRIEDVRTLAGRTMTISFWAQAGSGTPKIAVEVGQNFGTGGSPSAAVNTYAGQVTLSTSWARYSVTVAVPSISGKTIGTTAGTSYNRINLWNSAGSSLDARTGSLGIQSNTFNVWGVQVEYGSKATPFQTASGGSPQAELAMCQRYYFRWGAQVTGGNPMMTTFGTASSTTSAVISIATKVTMRATPTALDYGGTLTLYDGSATSTAGAVTLANGSQDYALLVIAGTGLTQYRPYSIYSGATNAYFGVSAEL
jgi:hypothetical protein